MPSPQRAQSTDRLNVLLILSDDLRGEAGGLPPISQPSLERLAERGMKFSRAYVQQPSCNPSRSSMLMGLRPSTTGVSSNEVFYRTLQPDAVTLPQAFLAGGYFTASVGKVFHQQQDRPEFDTWLFEKFPRGKPIGRRGRSGRVTGGLFSGDMWRAARGADRDQPDGAATLEVVRLLSKRRARPFFIAVGFLRPHTPYRAPRSYFRRYKLETFPSEFDSLPPADVPAMATPNASTAAVLEGMSTLDRKELARAYYASASFVDRQVGVLLDTLDLLDLWRKTVVIFTSDHGYHLGEHGWWGKNTLFEESLRVPLIIHSPTLDLAGKVSDRTVELLDLFPTLAELTGVEAPPVLEGHSLLPLLKEPTRYWYPAFSQTNRASGPGLSVRDDRWRYTVWSATEEAELYDTLLDPRETSNLAGRPEYAETEAWLAELLREELVQD